MWQATRRPTWTVVMALVCGFLSVPAAAEVEVGVVPLPDWVESLEIEGFAADRSRAFQGGLAYLLSDRQVRKTPTGFEYVERFAYEVIDRSGLEEAARITHTFDPTEESIAFNYVRILRDGREIDRLADAEIELLRQEQRLESSLIDGTLTALIQLEDVRVGDVIDFAYTGTVNSALWPGEIFWMAPVEWSVPLAQMHYRLLVPEDLPVHTRSIATDVEPTVASADGWTTYRLHVFDAEPIRFEQNVPGDWVQYGFVVFSTMASWSEVVDWALPLFTFDEPLPKAFVSKLDAIAAAHDDPAVRATHALRLVQDDIRYLGIETGLGSHVPRAPGVTLERGYGDCKDKSVLLAMALEYLGIDAVPALASLANGELLPALSPTLGAFDHVVVEYDIDGHPFWVDPTMSHQGGVGGDVVSLGYGYVLPIRKGQAELVKIALPGQERPLFEVNETFEIPASGDVGLRIDIDYIYRDVSADSMRYQLAGSGHDDLAHGFLDYYAANYDGVRESRAMTITDDLDGNVIVVSAGYSMDAATFNESDYKNELPIYATAVQGVLPRQVEADRAAPLRLPLGSSTRHVVRVVTPGRKYSLPEGKSRAIGGVRYTHHFEHEGDAFVMDFALVVEDEVAALETVGALTDLADEIVEDTEMVFYLDNTMPGVANRLGLGDALDTVTDNLIARVNQHFEDEEYVEALTGLNSLLEQHADPTPVRGYLLMRKAETLVELGRRRASIRPFEQAFELYQPPTPGPYFKYVNQLRREGRTGKIVNVIEGLLDRQPGAVENLNMGWFLQLTRDLHQAGKIAAADDLALAIVRAMFASGLQATGDSEWAVLRAIRTLSRGEDAAEAAKYLPFLEDPEAFALLMTSRKTERVWAAAEEEAGSDLSTAIADYVASTRLALNRAPDDYEALTRHITALRIAGKNAEASRIADLYLGNWARIEAVGEDAYWFVNGAAYALSDNGRKDEALALMSKLIGLGVADNSQLVSMAINHAEMLMHWEEYEAALEAVAGLEDLGDGYASDYGLMWIYDTKACSLHRLGRHDEAKVVLEEYMLPLAARNRAAHTKTLLCLGDLDGAAELIIDRLRDNDGDDNLVLSFSHFAMTNTAVPFFAELLRLSREVRQRPDVQAEFGKVGRAIAINGTDSYWGNF